MTPFLLFFLGLFFGSFANVVVVRLHKGESGIIAGESACPKCHHLLSWYENLPLVSWIFLRGKCRHCKTPISAQYPLVELFFGSLFLLVGLLIPLDLPVIMLWHLILLFALGILFLSDFLYQEVPDKVSLPLFAFLFVISLLGSFDIFPALNFQLSLSTSLYGALVIYLFFGIQILLPNIILSLRKKTIQPLKDATIFLVLLPLFLIFSLIGFGSWFEKKIGVDAEDEGEIFSWIGGGDLRIGIIMGFLLGWKLGIFAVFLAYALGAIVAVPLLLLKKEKRGTMMAFGPFLIIATLILLFSGEILLMRYLALFGL